MFFFQKNVSKKPSQNSRPAQVPKLLLANPRDPEKAAIKEQQCLSSFLVPIHVAFYPRFTALTPYLLPQHVFAISAFMPFFWLALPLPRLSVLFSTSSHSSNIFTACLPCNTIAISTFSYPHLSCLRALLALSCACLLLVFISLFLLLCLFQPCRSWIVQVSRLHLFPLVSRVFFLSASMASSCI